MRSPARGLKFCGARARVACVILAHVASRVTFHGCFEFTSANNTVQTFSGAKDSSLSRLVKIMYKWNILSLIFTPCCKDNCDKNKS